MSEQNAEKVTREPDETDDLPAIVRYHGANEVIDALLTVAAEAYGPDQAQERLHGLVMRRFHQADAESSLSPGTSCGFDRTGHGHASVAQCCGPCSATIPNGWCPEHGWAHKNEALSLSPATPTEGGSDV